MPDGWALEVETTIVKMVWDAPAPAGEYALAPIRLDPTHVAQARALAELTNPGPFGSRTIEMGEYVGYFTEGRLIAMAGERMHAGNLREVSAVCTHPDHEGRGLARDLMRYLVQKQLKRGELPFLHVLQQNARALRIYGKMGFRTYREMPVRIVSMQ